MKVWYRLKFRNILSDLIRSDNQYWWSDTQRVKYQEITVRNRIIKMLFWVFTIPADTWWSWQYLQYCTNTCYILQIYWTKLILSNTWQYLAILGNTWQYLAILGNTWQYLAILGNTWQYLHTTSRYLAYTWQ